MWFFKKKTADDKASSGQNASAEKQNADAAGSREKELQAQLSADMKKLEELKSRVAELYERYKKAPGNHAIIVETACIKTQIDAVKSRIQTCEAELARLQANVSLETGTSNGGADSEN